MTLQDKSKVHCWEGITYEDGTEGTCLKEAGHQGTHKFTPDSEIEVTFAD